jgi:hypothetical protein
LLIQFLSCPFEQFRNRSADWHVSLADRINSRFRNATTDFSSRKNGVFVFSPVRDDTSHTISIKPVNKPDGDGRTNQRNGIADSRAHGTLGVDA